MTRNLSKQRERWRSWTVDSLSLGSRHGGHEGKKPVFRTLRNVTCLQTSEPRRFIGFSVFRFFVSASDVKPSSPKTWVKWREVTRNDEKLKTLKTLKPSNFSIDEDHGIFFVCRVFRGKTAKLDTASVKSVESVRVRESGPVGPTVWSHLSWAKSVESLRNVLLSLLSLLSSGLGHEFTLGFKFSKSMMNIIRKHTWTIPIYAYLCRFMQCSAAEMKKIAGAHHFHQIPDNPWSFISLISLIQVWPWTEPKWSLQKCGSSKFLKKVFLKLTFLKHSQSIPSTFPFPKA